MGRVCVWWLELDRITGLGLGQRGCELFGIGVAVLCTRPFLRFKTRGTVIAYDSFCIVSWK